MAKKILFLHGWRSVPSGVKSTWLKDHGYDVIAPVLDDDDFDIALATAQTQFDLHKPDVIVGSSRGGALAMNIKRSDAKMVLLCPAWKKWGVAKTIRADTVILHSRADDVVAFSDSEELVACSGLSSETLIEIGNDHRLADDTSLSVMLWVCNLFASGQQIPSVEGQESGYADTSSHEEASYVCDACGEEIVIPLDLSEGSSQMYVEDCPVCCRANTIHVQFDDEGNAQVWAEPEQDYE